MRANSFVYAGLVVVLSIAAVAVTSCSTKTGAGGSIPTVMSHTMPGFVPTGPLGPTISFDRRNAAMEAIGKKFARLPHKNWEADMKTLATYMQTLRVFSKSGVAPAGVWGVFTDGRLFQMTLEVGATPPPEPATRPRSATPPIIRVLSTLPAAEFPPQGGNVRVLYNNGDPHFSPQVNANLTTALQHTGYLNAKLLTATVANFRSLRNLSMLFVETHGGNGYLANGLQYFELATSDKPDKNLDATAYKDDLDHQRLGYEVAIILPGGKKGKVVTVDFYFVTEEFFAKYVTFAPGGNDFAYISACTSASPLQGAQDFIKTLEQLGVSYYMGWTKEVIIGDLEESLAFFADRTLGEQNQHYLIPPASPPPGKQPETAYSAQTVYAAMGTINRSDGWTGTLQQSGNNFGGFISYVDKINKSLPPYGALYSQLMMISSKSAVSPLLLAPSIYYINVVEPHQYANQAELIIDGAFGSQPGTVNIEPQGGPLHTLPGAQWTADSITVPIPPSGANASGFVTVVSSTGIPSNEVPITMWKGKVTITDTFKATAIQPPGGGTPIDGKGNFASSAILNVQFRADVHPWRDHIEATPVPATLWFTHAMASSTGSVTEVSGSFTGSQTLNGKTTTYTFTFAPPPALPFKLFAATTGRTARIFDLGSYAASQSRTSCSQAVNDGSGLPLCLGLSANALNAATCRDDPKGTLCDSYGGPFTFDYNTNGYIAKGNLIKMTMDPKMYTVTVPGFSYADSFNQNDWPPWFGGSGTTNYSFSFDPPVSPPTDTTPAIRRI